MNELWKTLTFLGVALVLTAVALVSTRDRTIKSEAFNDQGQPFFPDFKDPLACTDLEVVDFDSSTASATRFRVMFKNNKWVIPSHYDYPADARDRLSKTAGAVIGLVKDTIRSDSVEDHENMGVVDPLDTKTSTLKGRGKRVTLRDAAEHTLADFIIGNEVKDKAGQRYVRVPGQKRTYGVVVKAEPSTRFADWIETNLLKLEASHIRKIEFDNYKVNIDQQAIIPGERFAIDRKDSSASWTLPGLKPDQELDSDKLRTLTDALADLKIVGVRTKPADLVRGLKSGGGESIKLTLPVRLSLASRGFYVTGDGKLVSNQGDVHVFTDEGIVYTIRFGEVIFGTGEELSAGTADDAAKQADEKAAAAKGKEKAQEKAKKAEGTTENRFVWVTAGFEPDLIDKPESMKPKEQPALKPGELPEIPATPFAPDPKDPKFIAEQKDAKEKADRERKDYQKKIEDGTKKAQDLTDRFAAWYYVTPADSFRSINLDRAALVKPKKAESTTPAATTPPSLPGVGSSSSAGMLPPIQQP
ncbi:MAG: DUF4340 domain-containing protein [Isosphaeraceae bacterium]